MTKKERRARDVAIGRERLRTIREQNALAERAQHRAAAFTYAIADGDGLIKIGIACDVEARLAILQTGNARELRVVGVMDGNHENQLHERFASYRVRGEWFKDVDEIRAAFAA